MAGPGHKTEGAKKGTKTTQKQTQTYTCPQGAHILKGNLVEFIIELSHLSHIPYTQMVRDLESGEDIQMLANTL